MGQNIQYLRRFYSNPDEPKPESIPEHADSEEAEKARTASKALFAGGSDDSTMPTFTMLDEYFNDNKIAILDLLTVSKLTPSKSEARRLVMQGGVLVNDEKITSIDTFFTKEQFNDKFIVKKGKKTFLKIVR